MRDAIRKTPVQRFNEVMGDQEAEVPFPNPYIVTERDPNGITPETGGAKYDDGKTLAWLCVGSFSRAISCVAEVTTTGAKKYAPNNWNKVPDGENRYMEATMRHLLSLGAGEIIDPGPATSTRRTPPTSQQDPKRSSCRTSSRAKLPTHYDAIRVPVF